MICWLLVWRSSLLMVMQVTGQSEIFQGNIFVSEKCWCTEVDPLTGKCWDRQKFPWEGMLRCTLLSYQSQTLREREKLCHFTFSHPQATGGHLASPCVCPGLWGHSKAPGQSRALPPPWVCRAHLRTLPPGLSLLLHPHTLTLLGSPVVSVQKCPECGIRRRPITFPKYS